MRQDNISPAWVSFRRVYWTIAATLAVLLLLFWLMGFGPGGRACKIPGLGATTGSAPAKAAAAPAAPPAPAVRAAPASQPAVAAVAAAPAAAPAVAPPPAAKLYFALDKNALPGNTVAALAPIATYLKANAQAKASISGFHDPSGNRARNEELALNRARAARGALERAGIERERIVMQKPTQTAGGGSPSEARRVEVSVQP
jgi:K(+)-stimulated pyrophosphate-energized sodium pump